MKKLIVSSALVASTVAYGVHRIVSAKKVDHVSQVKQCPSYPKTTVPAMQKIFDNMKKSLNCK